MLQELVTNVQFANDEGDPGMGLELGLNAFSFGGMIEAGLAIKNSLEGVSEGRFKLINNAQRTKRESS